MRRWLMILCGVAVLGRSPGAVAARFQVEHQAGAGDYVVLVHGLDWFRNTLEPTAAYLHAEGYETLNVRYPSHKVANPEAAAQWVRQVVEEQCRDPHKRIHLVGHSMGALVVREYLADGKPERLGRVVLLAAPNQGTPLAEALRWKPLGRLLSPAAASSCGWPGRGEGSGRRAEGVDYAPGVLMGNQPGWFPFFSIFMKGEDDGVVPVASGRLQGMGEFRVVRTSHTAMPRNREALGEVLRFLRTGQFGE